MTKTQSQLNLPLGCPSCGSELHDGCGYDPETVRPAMSVAEALSRTIEHVIAQHGYQGARERLPGLRFYGDARPAEDRHDDAPS